MWLQSRSTGKPAFSVSGGGLGIVGLVRLAQIFGCVKETNVSVDFHASFRRGGRYLGLGSDVNKLLEGVRLAPTGHESYN